MDTRLFPLSPVLFQEELPSLIEENYIWKGAARQRSVTFKFFRLFYMFWGQAFPGVICLFVMDTGILSRIFHQGS